MVRYDEVWYQGSVCIVQAVWDATIEGVVIPFCNIIPALGTGSFFVEQTATRPFRPF